ncbi:MAG: hypothetical protein NZM28_01630 [Fimbriimonadales bacterium]|nr:hypothetical protein [Fimbriimonadales bacterium]
MPPRQPHPPTQLQCAPYAGKYSNHTPQRAHARQRARTATQVRNKALSDTPTVGQSGTVSSARVSRKSTTCAPFIACCTHRYSNRPRSPHHASVPTNCRYKIVAVCWAATGGCPYEFVSGRALRNERILLVKHLPIAVSSDAVRPRDADATQAYS